jgi:outer membrane protein TolC
MGWRVTVSRPHRCLASLLLALAVGGYCAPVAGQSPAEEMMRLPPVEEEAATAGPALRPPEIVRLPPVTDEELPEPQIAPIWWERAVAAPLKLADRPIGITLDAAVLATLQQSPQVKAMSDRALARQLAIGDPAARFDVTNFVNSRMNANSDAVGNALTTGGASRLLDTNWNATAGVRKLQSNGGQWELSQRMGWQDTNSIYFIPANQGTSKMMLSYTHPMMRGNGADYQNSVIVLAEIDASMGGSQLKSDLQALLVEVNKQYWDLYLQRAAFLQRRRLHEEAVEILDELLARQDVDTLDSQILRARAAVHRREAAMTRHSANARNAEARLLAIISDPNVPVDRSLEVIPLQGPAAAFATPELQRALTLALEYRPEIQQAIQGIKAATIRVNVAQNEIQPAMNVVLGTYLNGLQGNSNFAQSYMDQFSVGRPSAFAGVEYETPWGSRAAKARYQQRQAELRSLTYDLQSITAQVRSEVEIASREIYTAGQQLKSRLGTIRATQREIDYLISRWRLLPGEGPDGGVVLNDILSEQERLADAELAFVTSQVDLNLAHVELLRATGTLLQKQNIDPVVVTRDGTPVYSLRGGRDLSQPNGAPPRVPDRPSLEGPRR